MSSLDAATLAGKWNYPTTMHFGVGRIAMLPDACRSLGMSRPLLITDPGLAKLPLVPQTVALNEAAGLPTGVFSQVRANPVGADVDAGVAAYKAGGHDGVIAFGGGSALDAAKAVALMVGQDRPLWDFEDIGDWWTRVNVAGMAPVVAVPTTSGTGSEVGRASVIKDEDAEVKKIIFHPNMLPAIVIADPALTAGLPPFLTAATGMDALSHSLEAFCAPGFHPMAEGIAVEGMRLVHLSLLDAFRDGNDLVARARMMAASSMGATAFQRGLGAMHAMAHPIGAVLDAHHGTINAVVMPYVLLFNRSVIEDRLARLSAYMGLPKGGFTGFLDWVLGLREQLGIPHTTEALGVTEVLIPRLAEMAAVDPSAGTNPLKLTPQNLAVLLEKTRTGDLS
ncbi:MAG: iron-containing alcohol dehydrogenase [Alphaproteobacteria bacterium]|nr:iron-containing alcohol dehydrogenase [Alphaproteobacteria bacterium]